MGFGLVCSVGFGVGAGIWVAGAGDAGVFVGGFWSFFCWIFYLMDSLNFIFLSFFLEELVVLATAVVVAG